MATTPKQPTPKVPASERKRVRLGDRVLVIVEDAIYVSIAVLLAVGAVVLVIRAAIELFKGATASGTDALIDTLDAILIIFIFVELLYAVRVTLKERQIVAEPFLVVGILVCIKEIVVLSVKGANEYIDKGPEFARAMTAIGLLGGLVLVLSASGVLLRRKEREPEENSGDAGVQG